MNSGFGLIEELKSIDSMLADISRKMPYSVPPGYFHAFPSGVHEAIRTATEPEAIPAWSKNMPFEVPQDYFSDLAAQVSAQTLQENDVPQFPKSIPFNVPAGYFDSLPGNMLEIARSQSSTTPARTIPLRKPLLSRAFQWAAAAVLVMGIGVGAYTFYSRSVAAGPDKILAAVPTDEIHDYLQHNYRVDIDRIVNNNDIFNLEIENKDIIQYLNETGWDVLE